MKIAIITSGILPVPAVEGGAVENLIDYYLNANEISGEHEITVYSISPKKYLYNKTYKYTRFVYVNTHSFYSRLKRYVFSKFHKCYYYHPYIEYFLYKIIKKVVRGNYDKILLENRPAFAPIIKKATTTPIYTHLHTDTINSCQNMSKEWLTNMNGVFAISNYIASQVNSVDSLSSVNVVHNGIDLHHFYDSKPICRNTFGFEDNDFILVYCGRIIPEKGIEQVIESMLKISSDNRNANNKCSIKLLIIGASFYQNDTNADPFVEHIKRLSMPLKDDIHFTGFIPYKDVPSYLKACDVAILPSLCEEAFGLSMLEAMACGIPVISTKAGGIPEVCGDAAFLFDRNENLVDNIVASVQRLVQDNSLMQQYRQLSLERSQRFGKDEYAQKMLDLLAR